MMGDDEGLFTIFWRVVVAILFGRSVFESRLLNITV
jgi:hypothetical protein